MIFFFVKDEGDLDLDVQRDRRGAVGVVFVGGLGSRRPHRFVEEEEEEEEEDEEEDG